ncbi:MAG: TetR/AcrR family transcriptional regulator [Anaerolineae bacterium]|nr:TetR/AcrR family transcriptional regulator [Anaerolineae bacterium]
MPRKKVPSDVLDAAFALFSAQGYQQVTMKQIAAKAGSSVAEIQQQYADKPQLLTAALRANAPQQQIRDAVASIEGDNAEAILRDATQRMVKVVQQHLKFFELASLDMQLNGSNVLASLLPSLLPDLMKLLERLKATDELRPVPPPLLARMFVAVLIGYIITEQTMPQIVQVAMKFFPQKAWLDGMTDLLLYGVLEDHTS